jgi:hypothetical protein
MKVNLASVIGATCIGGLPIFTVISVILLHQRLPNNSRQSVGARGRA